jgi:hypothetical protein
MASSGARKVDSQRRPLHTSKSFSRIEPTTPSSATRTQRASTIQGGALPEIDSTGRDDVEERRSRSDIFEKSSDDDEEVEQTEPATGKLSADFDELPIELISLADTYVTLR